MRLHLFRHGIAHDRLDPDCPPDPERQLTEEGITRTRRAARGLKVLGAAPRLIVVSPYLRAVETGRIAAEVLGLDEKSLVEAEELLPMCHPREFLEKLPDYGEGDLLCAGHAPQLDRLLAACVGERTEITAMKKAGAACIELLAPDRLPGELVWLLPPKALRRLGGAA